MRLEIGDIAPDFRLKDAHGTEIALKDFCGKYVIVYFYPKDNTSGCTLEAQDFTALLGEFENLDCVVVGISPDSEKSHSNFIAKHSLKHILLSDPDKATASKYGAYGEKMMYGKKVMGIIRSTFIIAPDGKILKAYYNVKTKNHAQNVLDDLKNTIKS